MHRLPTLLPYFPQRHKLAFASNPSSSANSRRHRHQLFPLRDFAFGNAPSPQVLVLPERPTRVNQQHLQLVAIASKQQ